MEYHWICCLKDGFILNFNNKCRSWTHTLGSDHYAFYKSKEHIGPALAIIPVENINYILLVEEENNKNE